MAGVALGQAQEAPGPCNLPAWGPAENVCFGRFWGKLAGSLGQAQEAPGPWNLPAWGPRTPGRTPQTPKTAENVCFGRFLGKLARSPPRKGLGGPESLESASLGPQTPLGVPPQTLQKTQNDINGEGFGVLIITD